MPEPSTATARTQRPAELSKASPSSVAVALGMVRLYELGNARMKNPFV